MNDDGVRRMDAPPPPDGSSGYRTYTYGSDSGGYDDASHVGSDVDEYYDDEYHDDDVVVAAPRRRRRAWPLLVLFLLFGVIGLGVWGTFWFLDQANPPGGPGAEVTISVPEGATSDQVVELLVDKKVIGSPRAFGWYTQVRPLGDVRPGDYQLHERDAFTTVVAALRKGPKLVSYEIVIPPGFTLRQVAARIAAKVPGITEDEVMALSSSGQVRSKFEPPNVNNLEGLLWADTYVFGKGVTAEQMLRRMVDQFDVEATRIGVDKVANVRPYDVIIIASMVQKEGRLNDELGMISRVIYNRLARGEKLQIDATLLYGKPSGSKPDIKTDTPYNTYTRKGLPPTPICIPGAAALSAAVNPTPGPWLFYVLTERSGRHAFSADYNQFVKDKADAKARGVF